jgi:hypothetical protein
VFAQRFIDLTKHFTRPRVHDLLVVPVILSIHEPFKNVPEARLPMKIVASDEFRGSLVPASRIRVNCFAFDAFVKLDCVA